MPTRGEYFSEPAQGIMVCFDCHLYISFSSSWLNEVGCWGVFLCSVSFAANANKANDEDDCADCSAGSAALATDKFCENIHYTPLKNEARLYSNWTAIAITYWP